MMMKYVLISFLVIVGGVVFYLYENLSEVSYKVGGRRGYSESIAESVERGVFVYELDCNIVPDSIKLIEGKRFFIEKAYRYGESSASETMVLDTLYQIIVLPRNGFYLMNDSLRFGFENFKELKKKYSSNIVYRHVSKASQGSVGEIILTPVE